MHRKNFARIAPHIFLTGNSGNPNCPDHFSKQKQEGNSGCPNFPLLETPGVRFAPTILQTKQNGAIRVARISRPFFKNCPNYPILEKINISRNLYGPP